VEHKNTKKINEMYYPRFTKVIIHHFMSKDLFIPRRNKVNSYYVRDDHMFFTIKLLKLVTKRSLQQTHISQASGSGADEGTGSISGVPDVPTDESEEELSWNFTDDEEEGEDDEQEYDEEESDEETRDEESFDPIPQTPENSDEEGNGEKDFGLNVGREEGHVEEEEEDELYRDVNINQVRGIQVTQEVED
nr:hypothetical protein [Tanacetum cinerariifolium]